MAELDFLKAIFTADSILIVERSGRVSWCNEFASALLGLNQGDVPSADFTEKWGLSFADSGAKIAIKDFAVDCILTGEPIECIEVTFRNGHTGSEELCFSITAEPVYGSSGEAEAAMVIAHDVTDRRRALKALEDSNAALRALVQGAPLPIVAMNVDGRINFWNPAAEQVFGWSESEVRGRYLPFVPEEKREEHRRMRQQDLTGQVLLNREIRRVRKDGSPLELSVSTAPIRDRHGAFIGTIGIYSDIGERRRLEEQLWHAARLESLGILAGGVAHDFNNLLTSILGNISMAIEDAQPGSHQARVLANAVSAVERAAVLTGKMLAYSGKGRFRIEPIDVSALIAGMAPLIESSIGENASLNLRLAEDLPAVAADRGQLEQIVMNVAINSGESIGMEGEVLIRTGVEYLQSAGHPEEVSGAALSVPGPHVFIEINDTGHGMDSGTLQRMFDPFFSTRFTGRGLGLAAVLGIVRGHKGTIRVRSAVNQGTRFVVYLPVS
jgi:two-component system cell cycle sensor histidine kinase/response regulator CckA